MDRLREMELFVRVVEAGSFSAAARDLGLGQPMISKAIAGLEERLAVRLLVRSTRQLNPTEAGSAFYERAFVQSQKRTKRMRQQKAQEPGSRADCAFAPR